MDLTPYPVHSEKALGEMLALLHDSFAYMESRIDPPSSLHRLTLADLTHAASKGSVWAIGDPVVACGVFSQHPDHVYLGKIAVAASCRGQGLLRLLVGQAECIARRAQCPLLRLETRIELTENHHAFGRLGFVEVAQTAHEGYNRPTSIVMEKQIGIDAESPLAGP